MRDWFRPRLMDYTVLLLVTAATTVPNLGATSLWDVDEGVNAQAAREMHEAGTWVIPTFNGQLRTAKPVLLYWLQRVSYAVFGVSEWSARFPSVLCGCLTVLLTYELARRMFGRPTGLLAGIVLASCIEFCVLARAATPDSPLLLFTVLTYYLFWRYHEHGSRSWWVPTAAACGLAVLTKGPVGLALPGLVLLAYFGWNGEWRRLLDRRIARALLVFLLVAGPWYLLVTSETRGAWAKAFFLNENVNRALTPMEDHRGPVIYHAAALLVLFAPWSVCIGAVLWCGWKASRQEMPPPPPSETRDPGTLAHETRAHRFLICWFGAYLVFFSLVSTKLPNYVLPLYPALAILTARFLTRWQSAELTLPRWAMPTVVGAMALVGVVTSVGLLIAGSKLFPGLESWAVLGIVPLAGAAVMGWFLHTGDRRNLVHATAVTAVVFLTLVAAFPPLVVDRYKAPRELVRECGAGDPDRDLRTASFEWFQPSVVFYTGREVLKLETPERCAEFLANPKPGVLFVSEPTWNRWVANLVTVPHRIAARHFDFYRNCHVLVVTNEPEPVANRSARLNRATIP